MGTASSNRSAGHKRLDFWRRRGLNERPSSPSANIAANVNNKCALRRKVWERTEGKSVRYCDRTVHRRNLATVDLVGWQARVVKKMGNTRKPLNVSTGITVEFQVFKCG